MPIKIFLIAALSLDGFIAQNESHSPFLWTSKEDKKRFIEITKRAGVIVMGSTTFETLPKPLKDRLNIVYSRSKTFEGAETTQKEPAELVRDLEGRGFKEVAICGGTHIYTLFMKSGLIETMYLTIEPIVFGKGMRLFDEELLHRFELVSSAQAENGALLLEYRKKPI